MTEIASWMSTEGAAALKLIVASEIPEWKNGLRDRQVEPISRILDGQDVILCTATGDGKSALFIVPILCHIVVSKSPETFPKFRRIRKKPVGVVINPTKGLARNIVETLARHKISALAYDRETIIASASEHRNLKDEILSGCFRIICIDPEHIRSSSWLQIFDAPTFQDNLIYIGVEELHLVREWAIFRQAYSYIGQFIRGRLRPDISVFGLSATLEPGIHTTEICQSLGFRDHHLFRFSNERLDIQLMIEPLKHAVSSRTFSQLLPHLNTSRKIVVYVQSYEISTNLYLYLVGIDTSGRPGHRIHQYNSLSACGSVRLCTTSLMETDSRLQIIIATITLANGVHSSAIDDVLMFQMPKSPSQAEQQAGRASRPDDATGKVVIFVQKSDLKNAKKLMASKSRKKKGQPAWERMDPAKAEFLAETNCLNAVRNRRWQNQSLAETDRDWIAAKRPLPCSLCAARANISVVFPPRDISHPPFPIPSAAKRSPVPRATKLKKKERPAVIEKLAGFGVRLFGKEIYTDTHKLRVKSWFFPCSLQDKLADVVLRLTTAAELDTILKAHKWPFRSSSYQNELWDLITQIQTSVVTARNTEAPSSKKRRAGAKPTESPAMEVVDEEVAAITRRSARHQPDPPTTTSVRRSRSLSTAPSPSSHRKRALEDVTNERATKSRTADKRTVKELRAEFGPARKNYRRDRR
ncbi:P-loop containing nucleoside triphosphate hydrolase protein [Mycena galopus ATCC 62051]|nr:P-loop containing nucleoside triphosphate hydrolase protein [Mycena galopus ATCC 62051]